MRIREIMSTNVQTIDRNVDIDVARQLMLWRGFRHLPVLDRGALAGILGESDVLAKKAEERAAAIAGHASRPQTAGDAMRVPAETIGAEQDARDAATRMALERLDCLVVVEDSTVVGIVTPTDLLAVFGNEVPGPQLVADAMTRNPLRLEPVDRVGDAVAIMLTEGVRHIPIVDAERRVVGILSDRDIRSAVGDPLRELARDRRALLQSHVGGVMTTDPAVIHEDAALDEAADVLVSRRIGALPVVDDDRRLVGIVSYVDVLQRKDRRNER